MRPPSTPRRRGTAGFTLIELLVVIAIVGIMASLAIAAHRHARIRGAEVAAIAALRAIGDAQFAFAQACGNGQYAPTLVSLGIPMPTTGQGFLSPDLALSDPVVSHGYLLTLSGTSDQAGTPDMEVPKTCLGEPGLPSYQATADPVSLGITGTRFFGMNIDRIVFEDLESFTGNMPPTGAPAHGTELR